MPRGRIWTALRGLADAAGYPMLITDPRGAVLHATPALLALVGEAEAEAIRAATAQLLARAPLPAGAVAGTPLGEQEICAAGARFPLRACLWTPHPSAGPVAIVSVERLAPAHPTESELREAYGLTPTEARVGLLLGRGLNNAEIAESLSISPHTARRHTERVLGKLDVRSRAEVAVRLLSEAPALLSRNGAGDTPPAEEK